MLWTAAVADADGDFGTTENIPPIGQLTEFDLFNVFGDSTVAKVAAQQIIRVEHGPLPSPETRIDTVAGAFAANMNSFTHTSRACLPYQAQTVSFCA
jgi:hypothetical protein